ncbi:hypothetical protein Tco_0053956 [Tanacetum coccineum]
MTTPSPSPPISLSHLCWGALVRAWPHLPHASHHCSLTFTTSLGVQPNPNTRIEHSGPYDAVTATLPFGSLHTTPSLYIHPVDVGIDILRLAPHARDAEERRQGTRDVRYGIRDTWVDPAEAVPEIAPMTVGEVNTRVTELAEFHEHDTHDLYALLEDAQDIWMVKEEAYASREAWAHSMGLSQATHQELQTHRDHVYAHETHLQAHQTQLQLQGTLIQTHHQPGPDARIPDHQDASGDADSHI